MTGGVAVVMGTRPEIIKLAPVVRALGAATEVVLTGQHYDAELTDLFLGGAALPVPVQPVAGAGGRPRPEQVLLMLQGLTEHFRATRPDTVVVQGDTNSANAGAQAAHYLGIRVVHVEAGLRSFDRTMPEEVNRLLIGALADVHCAATAGNAAHLLAGGAPPDAVHVTGNTIVAATRGALPDPAARARIRRAFEVGDGDYVLATVHRPENTDDPVRLARVVAELGALGLPVVLPLHPRTRAALAAAGLVPGPMLRLVPPVDHPTLLTLVDGARIVVSDSGGLQEEVTVLGRPMVVVRSSTERPEAVDAGFCVLTAPEGIPAAVAHLLRPGWPAQLRRLPSPFGDEHAPARIAALVRR